jgi:hypothetical protein
VSIYVDPVKQASEYQQLLLGLLGDHDPAEVMQRTPAELRRVGAAAGPRLRQRPQESEWSVFECIAHVADAELVISGRLRWILAHDEPPLVGYDQDRWVNKLHKSSQESLDELLAWFEPIRAANLRLWQTATPADKARVGIHSERGPESFELTFRLYAGHDIFHLDQARNTLDQVRGGG